MRILIALIFVLVLRCDLMADSPAPLRSYKIVTTGQKFVFVMLAPVPVENEGVKKIGDAPDLEALEIRRTYKQSGMYQNDGSTVPLWNFHYVPGAKVLPDGVHLILERSGKLHSNDSVIDPVLDQNAIEFYANGKLLRAYSIRQIVDRPDKLNRSVTMLLWNEWGKANSVNEERMEYHVSTQDGNQFVFDIRTGGILWESRVGPASYRNEIWILAIFITAGVCIILGFRIRRKPFAN